MKIYEEQMLVRTDYQHNVKNITGTFERIVDREPTEEEQRKISDISLEYALITWNIKEKPNEKKRRIPKKESMD